MLLPALTARPLLSYSTRPEWGEKKKELHQLPPVPAKLPRSRFTAELKTLLSASEHTCRGAGELPQAPSAPSTPGMAGCPHGHHEPPATALLSAGSSYPFLGQVSCGQGVLRYQLWKYKSPFMPGSRGFPAVTVEETLPEVSVQFRSPV